jgi:hypothetical protein
MSGPELGLVVHAPTSRVAIAIAQDLGAELRERAGLKTESARMTAVVPPARALAVESPVLDEFTSTLVECLRSEDAQTTMIQRQRYAGGVSEKDMAARCLTAAARCLRRVLGQDRDPRSIGGGEVAFWEFEAVTPMHLDSTQQKVQKPLLTALTIASDRLEPIPAGRLGSFKAPGQAPAEVSGVTPTTQDLLQIARFSGIAVAEACAQSDQVAPDRGLARIVSG